MLTQAEKDFVLSNLHGDVSALALKLGRFLDLNAHLVLQQIAGYQAIQQKIPSWYRCQDLLFPHSLSLEQCSSEETAEYKHQLISTISDIHTMADLTGGFGVDCSFMASGIDRVLYVERQAELCELAKNNFGVLGLKQIQVRQGDGVEVLAHWQRDKSVDGPSNAKPFDLIFLDPARRDNKGGKVVALSDCEPDLSLIKPLLLEKAKYVLVKLSPMLDITLALKTLPETTDVHIVSVDGECKELLFLLMAGTQDFSEPAMHCVNLRTSFSDQVFSFTKNEEQQVECRFANAPGRFLYEPNASLLKAGAFSILTQAYDVKKLHPNSHLYTADEFIADFPGRVFSINAFFPFKELKMQMGETRKANVTVRNFPNTVAEIRKKTGLRDGGEIYLFATTLLDEKKVLISCKKA